MANPGDFAYTVKQQADIVRIVGDCVKHNKPALLQDPSNATCDPDERRRNDSFRFHKGRGYAAQRRTDLTWIKRFVAVQEVIEELNLHRQGRMVCCWRPDNHQHGDRTPSVGIDLRRNRVKCFVCDARQLSVIDLVMSVLHKSVYEALTWIAARFDVPSIPIGKHLARTRTVHGPRMGVSANRLEPLVRSGLAAELSGAEPRLLLVLDIFTFRDTGLAILPYSKLRYLSGIRKDSTVARALKRLESLHAVEIVRGWAGHGRANCNKYRLTLDDVRFEALMNECSESPRNEDEALRELRTGNDCHRRTDESRPRRLAVSPLHLWRK